MQTITKLEEEKKEETFAEFAEFAEAEIGEEIIDLDALDFEFVKEVEEAGGENISACFQCGTCSGGCPTVFAMDYTPRQIIRMVFLGMREEVLKSKAIWVCSSCYTCQTRCPRGVKITEVMHALKSIAIRDNYEVANPKGPAFYRVFMGVVEKYGRAFEPEIALLFTHNSESDIQNKIAMLLRDAPLGLQLFMKGKLPLAPHKIMNIEHIKKLYEKAGVKK